MPYVGSKFVKNSRYAWETENLTEAEYDDSRKRLAKIGQLPYPIANWVTASGQLYRVLGTRRETYVIVDTDMIA